MSVLYPGAFSNRLRSLWYSAQEAARLEDPNATTRRFARSAQKQIRSAEQRGDKFMLAWVKLTLALEDHARPAKNVEALGRRWHPPRRADIRLFARVTAQDVVALTIGDDQHFADGEAEKLQGLTSSLLSSKIRGVVNSTSAALVAVAEGRLAGSVDALLHLLRAEVEEAAPGTFRIARGDMQQPVLREILASELSTHDVRKRSSDSPFCLRFFSPPPLLDRENSRQTAAARAKVLSSNALPELNAIVRQAAALYGVPIAAITIIDKDRHWFVAATGLVVTDMPKSASFCAHAILTPDEPFCVPDTNRDLRFAGNPLVLAPPGIRFYAGVPILDRVGQALGALCVINTRPSHPVPRAGLAVLERLAQRVSETLLDSGRPSTDVRIAPPYVDPAALKQPGADGGGIPLHVRTQ